MNTMGAKTIDTHFKRCHVCDMLSMHWSFEYSFKMKYLDALC